MAFREKWLNAFPSTQNLKTMISLLNNTFMYTAFATIIAAAFVGSVSSSSSSSSVAHSTRSLAAVAPALGDCTLQIIAHVKLPSLDVDVEYEDGDEDEVFECEIDPADVPGRYAGLSRQLDLTKKQKRQLKQLWQDGIVTPGSTKLRLADIAATNANTTSVGEGDTAVAVTWSLQSTTSSSSSSSSSSIVESHIAIPADLDMETLLVVANNSNSQDSRKLQSTSAHNTPYGVNTGTRSILVVKIIDMNGLQRPETPAQISEDIFGSSTSSDTVNLHSQILDCSMKRLNLTSAIPAAGGSSGGGGGIHANLYDAPGVITITVARDLTITPSTTMVNLAIIAIQDKFSITIPGPYGHVLFIIQKEYVDPGWAAWASLGSPTQHQWKSCYQGVNYKYVGVQVHEIGHNFGLRHSGGFDGCDYTDWTCLMGNPLYFDDIGKMCYNAAKSWQIGWYNDRKLFLSPMTQANDYTKIVTMLGIADYQYSTSNSTPVVLKLETNTDQDYFVGFNRAIGINVDNKQDDNEVTITQTANGHGESASQSWLRATLQVGEQYTISNFGGTSGTHVVVKFHNIIIENPNSGAAGVWKANITVSNVRSDTAPPTMPERSCPTPKPNTPKPMGPTPVPTPKPTRVPTNLPSSRPTRVPTTSKPSNLPSSKPTRSATTSRPTNAPTSSKPTRYPTTSRPTNSPTTARPTSYPTTSSSPTTSTHPSIEPSISSSPSFTQLPSTIPSSNPSSNPSNNPSSNPSSIPSSNPSSIPSLNPSSYPSRNPSTNPSLHPSNEPSFTQLPTFIPSFEPTITSNPTITVYPTLQPSYEPSLSTSPSWTQYPSSVPTRVPITSIPTNTPTATPTAKPSTNKPSSRPSTALPTGKPSTIRPSTSSPTYKPTLTPMASTAKPTTMNPTAKPTSIPTTSAPTNKPSSKPTTSLPTTRLPTTTKPSIIPTSMRPTSSKPSSKVPTSRPTLTPTRVPTSRPSTSLPTTRTPSSKPTVSVDNNIVPPATTTKPSSKPSSSKPSTAKPTTLKPSSKPSSRPTTQTPTTTPTNFPVVTLTTPVCSPTGNATTRQCLKQNGNMFSVGAKFNLNITSITVSVDSGTSVEVWTKTGGYIGFETNKNAWTRVGVSSFTGKGLKITLLSPIVNLDAGSRQSFYVTMNNNTTYILYGGNYTQTTQQPQLGTNNSVQNSDLVITMGTANAYPFGRVLAPRYFNGAVTYKRSQ